MVSVKKHGILLKPTKHEFENNGVLNPSCIKRGKNVHMYYRAVREGNYSTIGYCKLDGPLNLVERWDKPFMVPEFDYEKIGLEDPRIVQIDGTYYMTYVAYDGKNVRIALATSKDLTKFEKKGIISPEITYQEAGSLFRSCRGGLKERYYLFVSYYKDTVSPDVLLWNKDAFLFPKKIDGNYAMMLRILPDIQLIYFKKFEDLTLDFWKDHFKTICDHVVLESKHWYETSYIGGGCPPIETNKGWLLIYHAADDMDKGKTYRAGAALLDKKDPRKVIGHLHEPLFSPEEKWELKGVVNRVVFPTGAAVFGKDLYIYYGASDKYIATASVNLKELTDELVKSKNKYPV